MFKIVDNRRAWWPVSWPGVTEDRHELVENRIELRFTLLDTDANLALLREAAEMQAGAAEKLAGGEAFALSELYADFVERIASDWRHVAAENGEPLPWSRESMVRLMKVPGVFEAALVAYRACVSGRAEIRAGN